MPNLVSNPTRRRIERLLNAFDMDEGRTRGARSGRWVLVRCDNDVALGTSAGNIKEQLYPATIVETSAEVTYPDLAPWASELMEGSPVLLTVLADDPATGQPHSVKPKIGRLYCGPLLGEVALDRAGSLGGRFRVVAPDIYRGLTVKEVDGSPSYTGIEELRANQSSGLFVSQPSPGVADLDIHPATTTQAGVVSTVGQTWAGSKSINYTGAGGAVTIDDLGIAGGATGGAPGMGAGGGVAFGGGRLYWNAANSIAWLNGVTSTITSAPTGNVGIAGTDLKIFNATVPGVVSTALSGGDFVTYEYNSGIGMQSVAYAYTLGILVGRTVLQTFAVVGTGSVPFISKQAGTSNYWNASLVVYEGFVTGFTYDSQFFPGDASLTATQTFAGVNTFNPSTDAVALTVQGGGAGTANLTVWKNAGGTTVASISPAGVVTADGSGLTNLNASNLASGTIPSARIGTLDLGTW